MKIICTLSEYTKLARQCADIKGSANCYKCPFYKLPRDPKVKCDIEHFVKEIETPGVLTLHNTANEMAGETARCYTHVIPLKPTKGGKGHETR